MNGRLLLSDEHQTGIHRRPGWAGRPGEAARGPLAGAPRVRPQVTSLGKIIPNKPGLHPGSCRLARDGLIVDLRDTLGGFESGLMAEKLGLTAIPFNTFVSPIRSPVRRQISSASA
jgi:hypothetical protein